MNFGQIRNCLCNLEQRVEALETPGDLITENPDGGDPVEIQLGDYQDDVAISASGYVIISINGTKYKLLAELIEE